MTNLRKFLLGILTIVMCFTLVACNNTANNAVPDDEYEALTEVDEVEASENENDTADDDSEYYDAYDE